MLISIVKKSQLYFIFSFALMIAGGTLLLKLPFLFRGARSLSWLDALFTATSAVCVTGLSTVRISDFNALGQLLILLLIQLGGIGIMTLTTSILLVFGHKLSFGNTLLISNLSDRYTLSGTENLTRTVMRYTLFCEALGAALLLPGFMCEKYSVGESIWYALFHSVSAFCNAGFSPLDRNLVGQSAWIKLVVAALVVMGGLGVYVVYDIQSARRLRQRLRAQTRLTLVTTAILIVLGSLSLWGLQFIGGCPIGWLDACFQSVSARTAGFNAVPMDALTSSSVTVTILLMQIGASPGSTGGGIKTTTIALAVAAIYNTFKGNRRVLVYRREIAQTDIMKAFSLIVTYVLLVCVGAIAIQSLTSCTMQWAFFESASALGTVGLTLTNASPLTPAAELFIILYMFLGRVGLFTIFLFLLGRERKSRLTYPEERVIVS